MAAHLIKQKVSTLRVAAQKDVLRGEVREIPGRQLGFVEHRRNAQYWIDVSWVVEEASYGRMLGKPIPGDGGVCGGLPSPGVSDCNRPETGTFLMGRQIYQFCSKIPEEPCRFGIDY